jgi:hypothetical protein
LFDSVVDTWDSNGERNSFLGNKWEPWFTDVHRNLTNRNFLYSPHLNINPDFNWSRTVGNTPTTADGEFVEKWNVKANGMTFAITPTFYTSTAKSSDSGSERYVNVVISVPNSNDFEIYQTEANKISKYQEKKITFSAKIYNNGAAAVKAKFYVGFDTDNNGTDDESATSKIIYLKQGMNDIMALVETPEISIDNQANTIGYKLLLVDIPGTVNLDVYFIKLEFAEVSTNLVVNHVLEKVLIDNA